MSRIGRIYSAALSATYDRYFITKASKKQKLDISILEMNDKNNIRKYKVLQTPTLIINDEYKCNYEKFDYSLLKRLVMFYS